MKRLRSALLFFLVTVFAVTMMIGSFSVFAFGDEGDSEFNGQFFSGRMETRVKEGDYFYVPAKLDGVTIAVYNPVGARIGSETTPKGAGYKADSLGNYKVTYTADDGVNSYSYNVLCYEERDYFINVKETKEDFLPAFVAPDTEIAIPKYELAYKNSKGEIIPMETDTDTMGVEFSENVTFTAKGIKAPDKACTLNITFWAKTGKNTTKTFTKEYTVNVQKNFKDTTPPVLNTLTMPAAMNINSLYTLPTASATDNYDSNVFIEVKVTHNGQEVLDYKPDSYGYADTSVTPTEKVKFDNNVVKSFYPTELGSYKITFTAVDGTRNESTSHEYTIECKDKLAPKIVEFQADLIPTKWGLSEVKKLNVNSTEKDAAIETSHGFYLPFPVAVDNADKEGTLRLVITLTNPGNSTAGSRTIGRWDGTIGSYKNGDVTVDPGYAEYFKNSTIAFKPEFDENDENGKIPFSFDLINFDNDKLKDKDSEKFGDWTITYSVYDSQTNGGSGTARKTATINLANSFVDVKRPEIDKNSLDIPQYILINDEDNKFDVPQLPWKSDVDTALTVNYVMTSDGVITDETVYPEGPNNGYNVIDSYTIKSSDEDVYGGQTYSIVEIDGSYYMLITEGNVDYAFILGDVITLDFEATDDVGNVSVTEPVIIDILYASDIGGQTFEPEFFHFETELVQNGDETVEQTMKKEGLNLEGCVEGPKNPINIGGFMIPNIEHIDYTGFEIAILDPAGNPAYFSLNTYKREVTKDLGIFDLYVNDISLTPAKAGNYRVNVKIFDISGRSAVYGFSFTVTAKSTGGGTATAAAIGYTGSVRTQYELVKSYTTASAGENVIIREIKGYSFSLMNNIFTGLDVTRYTIHDFVAENFDGTVNLTEDWKLANSRKTYNVDLSNNEIPVIEIHGIFPKNIAEKTSAPTLSGVYAEGEYVELPVITGYTKYENATISMKITYKSTKNIDAYKIYLMADGVTKTFDATTDGVDNTFTGIFAFEATDYGDYTVSITATSSSKTYTIPTPYTIQVGPRTPVPFDVSPVLTAKVGDTFFRTAPVFESGADYERVEISLKGTDGKVIDKAGVSLSKSQFTSNFADNYEDSGYTFTDAGKYTLTYTVTNTYGVKSVETFEIEVSKASPSFWEKTAVLTTILIIVGLLLIAGVVIYIVRFRTVRK